VGGSRFERRLAAVDEARAELAARPDDLVCANRLGNRLVLLAQSFRADDQDEAARACLIEAKTIGEAVLARGHDGHVPRRLVSTVDRRLADVEDQRGDLIAARVLFESAVVNGRSWREAEPAESACFADLCESLTELARFERLNGNLDAADVTVTEATELGRVALEHDGSLAVREVAGEALAECSRVAAGLGDRDRWLAALFERVEVLQPIGDDAEAGVGQRAEFGHALCELADALTRMRDFVAARQASEEAVARLEALSEERPSTLLALYLGQALATTGAVACEQGRFDDADSWYDRMAEHIAVLAASEPGSTHSLEMSLSAKRLRLAVRRRDLRGLGVTFTTFRRNFDRFMERQRHPGSSSQNYVQRTILGSERPTVLGTARLAVRTARMLVHYGAAAAQSRFGVRLPGLPEPLPRSTPGPPDDATDLAP
jgi:tetratricopeptide (TPR) repeat protein